MTVIEKRVKPLVGHVGGHKATDCTDCLALAVAAYELGKSDLLARCVAEADSELVIQQSRSDGSAATVERGISTAAKIKARLVRLGESGERASNPGAGPRE